MESHCGLFKDAKEKARTHIQRVRAYLLCGLFYYSLLVSTFMMPTEMSADERML